MHKFTRFLESQGIFKNLRKVGRPSAPKDLHLIPKEGISENDVINTIINFPIRNADGMAKIYAIISKLELISPDTPMKTIHAALTKLRRYPWDEKSNICSYKAFVEACNRTSASDDDCKHFLKSVEETEIWKITRLCEEELYEIDGEYYTRDEINEYHKFLEDESGYNN